MSSGFVAGTLVHTDKGLIPIQNLQIGDLVFSKNSHDLNSKLVLKPIKNIIINENQEIFAIRTGAIRALNEQNQYVQIDFDNETDETKLIEDFLMFARNHCFWIMKYEFHADEYSPPEIIGFDKLRYFDYLLSMDRHCNLHYQDYKNYLEKSAFPNKGYYEVFPDFHDGILVDLPTYYEGNFVFPNIYENEEILVQNMDENGDLVHEVLQAKYTNGDDWFIPYTPAFTDKTYNLEVEDFHNYFVGKSGLWVGDSTIQPRTEDS